MMKVVNDLQMLPNTQFIENRVYEEPDIEPVVAETEPSPSARQVCGCHAKNHRVLKSRFKIHRPHIP